MGGAGKIRQVRREVLRAECWRCRMVGMSGGCAGQTVRGIGKGCWGWGVGGFVGGGGGLMRRGWSGSGEWVVTDCLTHAAALDRFAGSVTGLSRGIECNGHFYSQLRSRWSL